MMKRGRPSSSKAAATADSRAKADVKAKPSSASTSTSNGKDPLPPSVESPKEDNIEVAKDMPKETLPTEAPIQVEKEAAVKTTELSPEQEFNAKLSAACKKGGIVGCTLIQGIEASDDEDEEDEEGKVDADEKDESNRPAKKQKKELSAEQVSTLRYVLLTKARDQEVEKGLKFASCNQNKRQISIFDTNTGNVVISKLPRKIKDCMMKKLTKSQQFDKLLGLTFGLNEYDTWIHDSEMWEKGGGLGKSIRQLGSAWKELLPCSDEELGITDEFTRPGALSLLDQLSEKIKENPSDVEYCFDYGQATESKVTA